MWRGDPNGIEPGFLMSHLGRTRIGALSHKRDSENLLAVVAYDLQGILIHILHFFFFSPEEFRALGTFSDQHGHGIYSLSAEKQWT